MKKTMGNKHKAQKIHVRSIETTEQNNGEYSWLNNPTLFERNNPTLFERLNIGENDTDDNTMSFYLY